MGESAVLATRDGREAYEVAKAFGPSQPFSIGYKVNKARQRGGVQHIESLDVFEFSPVLHGANRYATQLSVKSATGAAVIETKSTAAVRPSRGRPSDQPIKCGRCGRPAATILLAALGPTSRYLCPSCKAEGSLSGSGLGHVSADELDQAAQLAGIGIDQIPEQAYEQAIAARWRGR